MRNRRYAFQDVQLDAEHRLFPFPQKYGVQKALELSAMCHLGAATALTSLVLFPSLLQMCLRA